VLWVFKCFEVEVELVVPTIDVQGLLKLECVEDESWVEEEAAKRQRCSYHLAKATRCHISHHTLIFPSHPVQPSRGE
jgi:hypothetical protein